MDNVIAAQVALPCAELAPTLDFFMKLGFRVETIFPADAPRIAVVNGHGLRLRLEPGTGAPGTVKLLCRDPDAMAAGAAALVAPNGTRVEFVDAEMPLALPPLKPSFVLSRLADGVWHTGRAGMRYRDLIPDRLGGRFIASHISIPDGGPVRDYVHFHKIAFQVIYCRAGWVRVVYEDQGEPFVMNAGDCVLQPPMIRHRVLESSPGLEVVEVTCPAEHETSGDLTMTLPTGRVRGERDYGGQRFVRHVAADARWAPWHVAGFEFRDTGIGAATSGLAGVRVARVTEKTTGSARVSDREFEFFFVLGGSVRLERDGDKPVDLSAGDSFAVPAGMKYAFAGRSADLELLEVTLPA